MKTGKAAGALTALLFLTAAVPGGAPASDAGFAAELGAISAAALTSAARQKYFARKAAAGRARPDASVTPGGLCTPADPDFQEYRYAERIAYCRRHVTQAMKLEVGAHYGISQADWRDYEFDHLIPLSIGGDSSVDNLWPEPNADNQGSDGKDKLELSLYLQMRDGKITQAEAVRQIRAWFDAFMLKRAEKANGRPSREDRPPLIQG